MVNLIIVIIALSDMFKGKKIPLKRQSVLSARLLDNFEHNLDVSCKVLGHHLEFVFLTAWSQVKSYLVKVKFIFP